MEIQAANIKKFIKLIKKSLEMNEIEKVNKTLSGRDLTMQFRKKKELKKVIKICIFPFKILHTSL